MPKLSVLVAFGGESSEHEISIRSAKSVVQAVDREKYDVNLCYIDRNGRWWHLAEWLADPEQEHEQQLTAVFGDGSFIIQPSGQKLSIDVLLPVLHGKNGEDGTIQGAAKLMHIPIVGCDLEACAVAMNKDLTKRLLRSNNIPTADWLSLNLNDNLDELIGSGELRRQLDEKMGQLNAWFIKPARSGSSVGVTKVTDFAQMRQAIDLAFQHDKLVLIEKPIEGRELEVAVLGNPPHHEVSGVGEIIIGGEFYDYDEKYSDDSKTTTSLSADLPNDVTEKIRRYSAEAYALVGCSGLARIDYRLDSQNNPFVLEINPIPGFTSISLYPQLWEASGVSYSELVDRLIQLAK